MYRANTYNRKLLVEALEDRRMLAAYLHSAAADFAADFIGNLPQNNPNGDWAYLAADDTTSSLFPTNGSSPIPTFGAGAGWAETGGVPSYVRGGVFGFPAQSLAGHGPQRVVWTAPAEVDLGGVELSGFFTQADFEPTRQMVLRINKNDAVTPLFVVEADFAIQTTIVPLPTMQVAINPGDTLTIIVDGSGSQGGGITPTFAAWDLVIEEIDPEIEADFNGNFTVDTNDLPNWETGFGLSGVATKSDGDADGDMDVDGADLLMWQQQIGNAINSGLDEYHPAAVIVQTSGVTIPDGAELDITGSQTQGLQEAFDYSAINGWDVFVLPGVYTLDAHLDVEELQLRTFRFEDVTLNFTSSVTDFGIRFDSTMQLDWYWNGGTLNAPNAVHGVLYQPHTPHPKDGPIFGTVGVVDSRFQWNADIVAGTHKVTMDSAQAVINDTTFHFKNAAQNGINFVGSGFTETNIFSVARTDDPIPFDLFSTTGRVTVIPPRGQFGIPGPDSLATVYKPDGTVLNTTGTQTSGLQEAFDYAAANDLDLLVFGRGVRTFNPNTSFGHYTLNSTLTTSSLVDRTYKIYGVTFLNLQQGGTVFELTDLINSQFELTGEVVGPSADTIVHIQPQTLGINNSVIRLQHPVGVTPDVTTNVHIDPSLQSVEFSQFYFHEVNQGQFGIKISNPSATTYFRDNFLRSVHAHETSTVAIQLGESEINADRILSNTLEVRPAAATFPSLAALQVWGDFNFIDLVAVGSGQTFGAKFEPGSNNNTLLFGTISASTPIADLGVNNTFISKLIDLSMSVAGVTSLEVGATSAGSLSTSSTTDASVENRISRSLYEGVHQPLAHRVLENKQESATDVAFARLASEDYDFELLNRESLELDLARSELTTLV